MLYIGRIYLDPLVKVVSARCFHSKVTINVLQRETSNTCIMCACVCVCTFIYKMWGGEGWID